MSLYRNGYAEKLEKQKEINRRLNEPTAIEYAMMDRKKRALIDAENQALRQAPRPAPKPIPKPTPKATEPKKQGGKLTIDMTDATLIKLQDARKMRKAKALEKDIKNYETTRNYLTKLISHVKSQIRKQNKKNK